MENSRQQCRKERYFAITIKAIKVGLLDKVPSCTAPKEERELAMKTFEGRGSNIWYKGTFD